MKKYLASLLFLLPMLTNAHTHSGYYYGGGNLNVPNGNAWMRNLANEDPVLSISIPGTHDSASLYGGPYVQTQTLTIPQQLKAGIRFLDIRGRPTNGSLAIHHGEVFQNKMFGEVLNEVITFLRENPSEFVLMRVKEEHSNNEKAFLQALNNYVTAPQNKPYIWTDSRGWTVYRRTTVGDVRGKIVLLREAFDSQYMSESVGAAYSNYHVDDSWVVNTNWDLYSHWEKKKSALNAAQVAGRARLTYLSGADIAFPYFVVSGHSSPGTGAPRLATGYTTPGWSWKWQDFPRVDCLGSLCTIAFEGTNILATELIKKANIKNTNPRKNEAGVIDEQRPNGRYVGVVATDFPGAGFIEAVIAANRVVDPDRCSAGEGCITMSCDVGHVRFGFSSERLPIAYYSKSGNSGSWEKLGPFYAGGENTGWGSEVGIQGNFGGLNGFLDKNKPYYRKVRTADVVDIFTWEAGADIALACFPDNVHDRIDGKIWNYIATTDDGGMIYFYDREGYGSGAHVSSPSSGGEVIIKGSDVIMGSNESVGQNVGVTTGGSIGTKGVSVGGSTGISTGAGASAGFSSGIIIGGAKK
ncbi:phosphatidylinositol-specific phospholipase C [Pseudomonas turukhanskensis]|uniref:1-phosphatidylinositol phosphodiesterase n=1 Tax=Pseudomonas turukhanskensis TaxID=1806536 RepID=A0A9W6NIB7_9PSED|nr:phosphatidylinositol-specific phospholipase C [Pseudomonas turukhanskensis]GLK91780.1 hypothetical protein GCM10017655_48440 [Pseudomonas turukhanskensis]